MLILTLQVDEKMMIGDDVTVTALATQGKKVRIGVAAPRSVSVHREEIYNKLAEEKRLPEPA